MTAVQQIFALLFFAAGPFLLQVGIGELLFARAGLRRRTDFGPRLALALAVELLAGSGIYALCSRTDFWLVNGTLCYLLLFLLSLILPFLCFEGRSVELVLCAVSGYMIQHISAQFVQMLFSSRELSAGAGMEDLLVMEGLNWLIFGLTAALVWFLFIRGTARNPLPQSAEQGLFLLSLTMLVVVLVLSSVRDAYADESFALMLVSRLFSVSCCVFLFYLRVFILDRGRMEQEREELLRLRALEQEQYEQSRENIELINIKCHDLKRRMERWERAAGQVPPEEIQEMKRLVDIYDSAVKTGNDTLDTLLTERSLYCEKQGIRLSCMVDGKKLSFMPVGDICSLFGNALENAIEAVSRLESPEERNISFLVRESRGMLVVTVDNCYVGELVFEDGLPQTTKTEDVGYHGYGMKSIRMVAEKYGGQVTAAADELFHLTVLIPLPETDKA